MYRSRSQNDQHVDEVVMQIVRGGENNSAFSPIKTQIIRANTPRIPSPPIPERHITSTYNYRSNLRRPDDATFNNMFKISWNFIKVGSKPFALAVLTSLILLSIAHGPMSISISIPLPLDFQQTTDPSHSMTYFKRNSRSRRRVTPLSSHYYPNGGPVLVTLVTNLEKDVSELQTALSSLEFLRGDDVKFPTPVLVFNEGDLTSAQIDALVEATNRPIAFPVVDDFSSFPEGFDDGKEPTFPLDFNDRKKWGYYHMIQFWISGIWKHPALKPFDVVVRFDSDSCFKEVNEYLPHFAHEHLTYQSQYVGYEAENTKYIENLFPFVQNYMARNKIVPRNPMLWQFVVSAYKASNSLPVFQTNLEIMRKSFMQRDDVKKFHRAIIGQEPFGVFRYRWGDAVVRFITMALFADDGFVMNSEIPGYYHKEHCRRDEVLNAVATLNKMDKMT